MRPEATRPAGRPAARSILTVDVEDWPQSTLNQDLPLTDRVVANTRDLLDLFDRSGARGTFFVLGLVAERFPSLVREIATRGHEVASHGRSHRAVASLGAEGFRDDLRRSLRAIEDALGGRVLGYRAPDFSIGAGDLWALEILAEEGLVYDSSIFPFRGRRYGIPEAFREPGLVRCRSGRQLVEFPLTTIEILGARIPVAGGGYFRLLPYGITRQALRAAVKAGTPAVCYFHPYEIDVEGLRHAGRPVPPLLRLGQGLGRRWVARRLARLTRDFAWAPARDFLQDRALFSGRTLDLTGLPDAPPRWERA